MEGWVAWRGGWCKELMDEGLDHFDEVKIDPFWYRLFKIGTILTAFGKVNLMEIIVSDSNPHNDYSHWRV